MSEHIILATLPGQAVSAVTFTAPSEPVLGQALTDNGDYLADWSDCCRSARTWFNARWQEAWRLLSQRHGDALPVEPPPVAAPEWLGKVRLSWQNEAFSRGQMRVEARHPAGEWLPLSPAEPLPAPQTHYQGAGRPSTSPALTIRLPLASAPVRLRAATSWRNTASFTIRTPLHD